MHVVLLLGGAGGGLLSNVSAACDDSLAAALISEDPNDGLEGHVAVVVSRSSKLECRLGASLDCFLECRQYMIAILRDHERCDRSSPRKATRIVLSGVI